MFQEGAIAQAAQAAGLTIDGWLDQIWTNVEKASGGNLTRPSPADRPQVTAVPLPEHPNPPPVQ